MMLNDAQRTALAAALRASQDATIVAALAIRNDTELARYINATNASPSFTVWRSVYTPEQIADAIEVGITQLDALTASKREVLLWWAQRPHNPANSQTAIADMCGSQNTLKAAVIAGGKRLATIFERVFVTGTGSDAVPGTLVVEGPVSVDDVSIALNRNP